MSSVFIVANLSPSQRMLRSNIRNAYFAESKETISKELDYRIKLCRSQFELDCFRELLGECE
jgi:hypothetical protein